VEVVLQEHRVRDLELKTDWLKCFVHPQRKRGERGSERKRERGIISKPGDLCLALI